jgi:hypothetical protein
MHRRFVILAGLALLTGCASTPPDMASGPGPAPRPILAPPGSSLSELEPLYAAWAGRDGLTLSVASSGCTRKEDFAFFVERRGETVSLAFGRKRLDTCKSFAIGRTQIVFSYSELGVGSRTPLFLLNPLVAWTGPGE